MGTQADTDREAARRLRRLSKPRLYTRAELEEVARLSAGAGAGAVMALAPDVVMPTEAVIAAVEAVLEDFDECRGAAASYTAEQLSGTRSAPIGRVKEGEEFPGDRARAEEAGLPVAEPMRRSGDVARQ